MKILIEIQILFKQIESFIEDSDLNKIAVQNIKNPDSPTHNRQWKFVQTISPRVVLLKVKKSQFSIEMCLNIYWDWMFACYSKQAKSYFLNEVLRDIE